MVISEVPAGRRRKGEFSFAETGGFESVGGSSIRPVSDPVEDRASAEFRDVGEIGAVSKTKRRGKERDLREILGGGGGRGVEKKSSREVRRPRCRSDARGERAAERESFFRGYLGLGEGDRGEIFL